MNYYLLQYKTGVSISPPVTVEGNNIGFPLRSSSSVLDHLQNVISPANATKAFVQLEWASEGGEGWRVGTKEYLEDAYVDPGIILMNHKTKHLCDTLSLPPDACFVPTEVSSGGIPLDEYTLLFSQEMFDVVDRSASIFDCIPGTDRPWHVFVWSLNRSQIPSCDLFRSCYAGKWVASERFVRGVEVHSIRGFDFIPIWSTDVGPLQCIPSPYYTPPKVRRA